MSTVVVFYGLLLGAPWHYIVIKLTPLQKTYKEKKQKNVHQGLVKVSENKIETQEALNICIYV